MIQTPLMADIVKFLFAYPRIFSSANENTPLNIALKQSTLTTESKWLKVNCWKWNGFKYVSQISEKVYWLSAVPIASTEAKVWEHCDVIYFSCSNSQSNNSIKHWLDSNIFFLNMKQMVHLKTKQSHIIFHFVSCVSCFVPFCLFFVVAFLFLLRGR